MQLVLLIQEALRQDLKMQERERKPRHVPRIFIYLLVFF
jgi:hypothetical protein